MHDPFTVTPLRGGAEVGPVALRIDVADTTLLLDCGSSGSETDSWAGDLEGLDAVWVSHAHFDHCGALPDLLEGRPRLPYYCTAGTDRLAEVSLRGHPACDAADAEDFRAGFRVVSRQSTFEISSGPQAASLQARAYRAGHLLGASMLLLETETPVPSRMLYTGDFCCHDQPLVPGALLPKPSESFTVDTLVMEGILATNKDADSVDYQAEITEFVDWVAAADGPVLVAANPLGEAVEFAQALSEADLEPLLHPSLKPVVVAYTDAFGEAVDRTCREVSRLRRALAEGGVVVAPGDQLGEGTASRHLAEPLVARRGARIAVANRAYPSSTAGRLLEAESGTPLEWLPGEKRLRAEIRHFSLPTHAPRWQLVETVRLVDPERVILVHGRESQLHALGRAIGEAGCNASVEVPSNRKTLQI